MPMRKLRLGEVKSSIVGQQMNTGLGVDTLGLSASLIIYYVRDLGQVGYFPWNSVSSLVIWR